jgi:hypothetical protein
MSNVISDEAGVKLHHRKVLENNLTPNETAQLEAWYAKQDQLEAASLKPLKPSLEELRAAVALAEKMIAITQNEAIKAEIAAIKLRLKEPLPALAA